MPYLIGLALQGLWSLFRFALPWLLGGAAVSIGVATGKLQELFWWGLAQFISMSENFLAYVKNDTGMVQVVDLNDLPADAIVYLSHMRIPEAMTIILSGMAIRMVRKMVLRF